MTTGVCFSLQPGHYRLTSDFVGTKLDRRLSGRGSRRISRRWMSLGGLGHLMRSSASFLAWGEVYLADEYTRNKLKWPLETA